MVPGVMLPNKLAVDQSNLSIMTVVIPRRPQEPLVVLRLAGAEMGGDARELERLFSRKRLADWTAHEQEIHRRIAHIEIIARRFHHR